VTRYTEKEGNVSVYKLWAPVDVLLTYSCSSFQSSRQASGCFDGPLRLSSVRQSHFGPMQPTISPPNLKTLRMTCDIAHHMFPARHQSLIYNLRSIVSSRVYMHTLLDHRVRPCAQRLSRLVPTWLYLGFDRLTVGCLCRHRVVVINVTAGCRTEEDSRSRLRMRGRDSDKML